MQAKKVDSIFAEHRQETFEFSAVKQLPDGRLLSNVQNHSHEDGEAHIYPVYFDVAQDDTVIGAHVAECGCPGDEYHDDECKHRVAASECGELLGRVIETALGGEDEDGQDDASGEQFDGGHEVVATDGGVAVEDIDRVRDEEGVEWTIHASDPDEIWLDQADGGEIWFVDRDEFVESVDNGEIEVTV